MNEITYKKPKAREIFAANDYANFKRKYKMGAELGRGGFGTVYAGFRIHDGKGVACKYISRTNVTEWKEVRNAAQNSVCSLN